jgi:hypothetical protein
MRYFSSRECLTKDNDLQVKMLYFQIKSTDLSFFNFLILSNKINHYLWNV